jgi:hypothetical protein
MRNTAELIEELWERAEGNTVAAIIVSFEEQSKPIFSNLEPIEALTQLNEAVEAGGIPMGFIAIEIIGKQQMDIKIDPMREWTGQERDVAVDTLRKYAAVMEG